MTQIFNNEIQLFKCKSWNVSDDTQKCAMCLPACLQANEIESGFGAVSDWNIWLHGCMTVAWVPCDCFRSRLSVSVKVEAKDQVLPAVWGLRTMLFFVVRSRTGGNSTLHLRMHHYKSDCKRDPHCSSSPSCSALCSNKQTLRDCRPSCQLSDCSR